MNVSDTELVEEIRSLLKSCREVKTCSQHKAGELYEMLERCLSALSASNKVVSDKEWEDLTKCSRCGGELSIEAGIVATSCEQICHECLGIQEQE